MITIEKNGKVIQEFPYTSDNFQAQYDKAMDIAGGMWNGKDTFIVKT